MALRSSHHTNSNPVRPLSHSRINAAELENHVRNYLISIAPELLMERYLLMPAATKCQHSSGKGYRKSAMDLPPASVRDGVSPRPACTDVRNRPYAGNRFQATISAPLAAISTAIARPMPLAAPVTMATLSCSIDPQAGRMGPDAALGGRLRHRLALEFVGSGIGLDLGHRWTDGGERAHCGRALQDPTTNMICHLNFRAERKQRTTRKPVPIARLEGRQILERL